jgi:hypothetical protein
MSTIRILVSILSMRKNNKKQFLIGAAVVLGAVILLGFNNFKAMLSGGGSRTTRELAMSCTLDMYTQFHIHPHLRITVNGAEQTIPANAGITLGCMHPIHTHDTSGIIHVESPEQRDFTLGDFFAVWDKAFSKDEVLGYHADATHEIKITVDGAPSDAYENLVFLDKQEVLIEYKAK